MVSEDGGRDKAALQETRIEEAAVGTPMLQLRLLLVVLTLAGIWIARALRQTDWIFAGIS